ncbi:hypothetical protein EB796_020442 [Bugula neritina]|uniref:Uncharacterized protein n=1 Tax=Bugula neritina TaxID=10212 RepID=A0A7J7J4Y0_BUGNE|nr:hypothetical protein EB796_020442 [Bugula neritina]
MMLMVIGCCCLTYTSVSATHQISEQELWNALAAAYREDPLVKRASTSRCRQGQLICQARYMGGQRKRVIQDSNPFYDSLERRYSDYDTPTQESVNYGREFLPIQRETPTDSLDGQEIQKDLLIELLKEYIRRNDKNESSSKENTSL